MNTDARGYVNARDNRQAYADLKRDLAREAERKAAEARVAAKRKARVAQRELDTRATRELERTGMTCPECEGRVIVSSGRVVCTSYGSCELAPG